MAAQTVQEWLHYVYPAVVFVYFAATTAVAACTLQTTQSAAKPQHAKHSAIFYMFLLFVATYVGQLVLRVVKVVVQQVWPSPDTTVGLLSCVLVFGIELSALCHGSHVVWQPFYGSWLIALVLEPAIAALAVFSQISMNGGMPTISLWIDAGLMAFRYVTLLLTVLTYFMWRSKAKGGSDEEHSPLLPKPIRTSAENETAPDSGYGTTSEEAASETNSPSEPESPWERQEREAREQMEKRLKDEGNWIAYAKGFLIFLPYIWPIGNRRLQVQAALVGVCLVIGNVLNLLVPRQLGIVMDTLSGATGLNPWAQVILFAALKLAASQAGIDLIRQLLWLPVEYYSQEALTTAAYSHVMNLSAEFHDSKSSSDLLVAISQGGSISNILESVCFQALPSLVDLVIAFVYLSTIFGPYEGFITVATAWAFLQASAQLISRYKEKRKEMVKTFFEEHYVRQAGIQGWQTVSAFNQVGYEEQRHSKAVHSQVSSMKELYVGYMIGHALQYLVLLCGLIAGAFLAVYQVTYGQRTAGDFVMLLTYWGQLTSPLQFFASLGKNISQDLVYAERLLDVMLTKPTVVDKPDAKILNLKGGKVELRNVSFSYDKKKDILKGVKLYVHSGKTAAFVGATGAGKSTILRLLDRFYDVTGGSILIDGQDIRDVKLSSLRQSIGIVPQAPVLFDDTIINNIRYARLDATDDEVYAACKAAAIHDHVMTFTEGYQTRVGERGVKLSGGELQRIAIARAILKQPKIVLLDEATSSVDTETEQKIQDGFRVLCNGRTTFIVAHRLSTVMNADIIFVVDQGQIVERGSHEELLERKGKYSELWSKQIFVRPKSGPDTSEITTAVEENTPSHTEAVRNGSPSDSTDTTIPFITAPKSASQAQTATATPHAAKINGKASGQAAKTPQGHKKEGSRLNPGAPEFTPRSGSPLKKIKGSPLPNDWAADVEASVASQPQTTPKPATELPSVTVLAGKEEPVKTENIDPKEQSPATRTPRAQDRHEEAPRSVSDPVKESSVPSTPTPTKSEPARPAAPLSQTTNIAKSPPKPSQRNASSSSRGGSQSSRGRGRHASKGRKRGGHAMMPQRHQGPSPSTRTQAT